MHIGELAEKTGLSVRTVRHYDDVGLLPASARTDGGFRVYTERDLERLLVIRRMKPLGFTLEQMADLLALMDQLAAKPEGPDAERLKQRLSEFLEPALQQRAKMARNLAQADELIAALEKY
jgi:DNA-binding transcriptional MerR regulator